ncbi:MAG: hypothetical protein Q4E22_06275 [Coriobacteriia bacterium]|nr:hypothetical protein [Coriobacteriia bacterium]
MKKILSILAIVILLVPSVACTSAQNKQDGSRSNTQETSIAAQEEATAPEQDLSANSESQSPSKTEANKPDQASTDPNKEAKQAYQDFLEDKRSVKTSDFFKIDDDEGANRDGLGYGEYTYAQVKKAIEGFLYEPANVLYAFDDVNRDGVSDMIINFETADTGPSNWVGFITYKDKNLTLLSSFNDTFINESKFNIYTAGIVEFINSYGNLATMRDVHELDHDGILQKLFSETISFDGYLSHLHYDIDGPLNEKLQEESNYLGAHSSLRVREYKKDGKKKIAVENWSEDPQLKAKEKNFIDQIVKSGVELISAEEINRLTALKSDQQEKITWETWEKGNLNNQNMLENIALMIDYIDPDFEFQYLNSDHAFTVDPLEYSGSVVITTLVPIKNLSVFEFTTENLSDTGEMSGSTRQLFYLEEFSPGQQLMLNMPIQGTYPNVAVGYHENNYYYTYAISMKNENEPPSFIPVKFR